MLHCRQSLELMRHTYNGDMSPITPEAKEDIFRYFEVSSNPRFSFSNLLPSRLVLGHTTLHRKVTVIHFISECTYDDISNIHLCKFKRFNLCDYSWTKNRLNEKFRYPYFFAYTFYFCKTILSYTEQYTWKTNQHLITKHLSVHEEEEVPIHQKKFGWQKTHPNIINKNKTFLSKLFKSLSAQFLRKFEFGSSAWLRWLTKITIK